MTIEDTIWEVVYYMSLALRTIAKDVELMFWILFFGELYFFYRLGEFIRFRWKYY